MSNNPRCLYSSGINSFLATNRSEVLGILCEGYHGNLQTTQIDAWDGEIEILQKALLPWKNTTGKIIFEYDIPRLGKRIDVVLLLSGIVFCIEFKVGESEIKVGDVDQVLDYALDLKNFHKFSEDRIIVPILVATRYNRSSSVIQSSIYDDRVLNPLMTGSSDIKKLITDILERFSNESPVNENWIISPYAPTPTIIEAARTLYESHSVTDITRHEADKVTTDTTIAYILDVIHKSTIVCLVGGGQEINTGEAGITEWISSLNNMFPHWKVYISPKLTECISEHMIY